MSTRILFQKLEFGRKKYRIGNATYLLKNTIERWEEIAEIVILMTAVVMIFCLYF
jgi:hypothetical protein